MIIVTIKRCVVCIWFDETSIIGGLSVTLRYLIRLVCSLSEFSVFCHQIKTSSYVSSYILLFWIPSEYIKNIRIVHNQFSLKIFKRKANAMQWTKIYYWLLLLLPKSQFYKCNSTCILSFTVSHITFNFAIQIHKWANTKMNKYWLESKLISKTVNRHCTHE